MDAGGNFVDTADAYGAGRSEEIVGSWLQKKNRDDIVVATKVRFGDGLNRRGLGRKHILGIIPWSPLRGGWLTGKFRRGDRPSAGESRIGDTTNSDPGWTEAWGNYDNERTWKVIDALTLVAEKIDRTPAQVALNWLLERPGVTAPILGVRSPAQLDNNLAAVGWELDEGSRSSLDEASKKPAPYPYTLLEDLRDV